MNIKKTLEKIPGLKRTYHWVLKITLKCCSVLAPELRYRLNCRISAIGKWPDLKNPKTYYDKSIWIILNWNSPLKAICTDKYAVRKYLTDLGHAELLTPLVGVWDKVENVPIDSLPDKFALKCTHGCGCNLFCTDKAAFNVEDAKKKLTAWMKRDWGMYSGERHYRQIRPRIICEEYLEDGKWTMPIDYKFYCFGGKFKMCMVVYGRQPGVSEHNENYFDRHWNLMHGVLRNEPENYEKGLEVVSKPENYERMVGLAEELAKPFPIVRVDFYSVNGKIVFGELTFTSHGGIGQVWTDRLLGEIGDMITLPEPIPYKKQYLT